MATTEENDGYSHLDNTEEAMYIFGMFVVNSIGMGVAFVILFSFYQQRKQIENKASFRFAVLSVTFSLCLYWFNILLGNNLIIPWQYDGEHQSFVSITDAINNLTYIFGKIAFYCSFTYNLLSLFDKRSGTRKYLIIWMIIACFVVFVLGCAYLIADITEQSSKEIGVTSPHHFYVTMLASHEGADYAKYFALMGVAVDMLYFVILLYFYIKQLKSLTKKERNENGTKGVVLISVACLILWIDLILIAVSSSFVWISSPIDVISDDVCLFLMFSAQIRIYKFMCKGCDVCCNTFIYGSKGYGTLSDDDNDVDQSEDLLANHP